MAAGHLPLRSRDLHRRHRPGRRARAGARQGQGRRRSTDLHRRPARGIRARLRFPDVSRQRDLRGRVPARHVNRATADREAPDRDRARNRRRRGVARRHRQGQRPGPFRAGLLRARAGHQGDRAVARMGSDLAREAARVRRAARHPDRDEASQRWQPVLHGRQPAAHQLRGPRARGPVAGSRGGHVALDSVAGKSARRRRVPRDRIRARRHRQRSTARH